MTTSLSRLWQKFKSRRYREAFVDAHLSSTIAAQIQTMRLDREMTQVDLAERCNMKQSRISVLEDPENTSLSVATLKRVAAAFNVALIIRFVPYSAVARWASGTGKNKFSVQSFDEETEPKELAITASGGTGSIILSKSISIGASTVVIGGQIETSERTLH